MHILENSTRLFSQVGVLSSQVWRTAFLGLAYCLLRQGLDLPAKRFTLFHKMQFLRQLTNYFISICLMVISKGYIKRQKKGCPMHEPLKPGSVFRSFQYYGFYMICFSLHKWLIWLQICKHDQLAAVINYTAFRFKLTLIHEWNKCYYRVIKLDFYL